MQLEEKHVFVVRLGWATVNLSCDYVVEKRVQGGELLHTSRHAPRPHTQYTRGGAVQGYVIARGKR
jgi:hypothetical protein